jgi:poly(3-hydroxybutyrate) depolymerase
VSSFASLKFTEESSYVNSSNYLIFVMAILFKHSRMMLLNAIAFCIMIAEASVLPTEFPIPPFVGCGKALPYLQHKGSVSNVTIPSGGYQRSYLVFIPPTYDADIPTPIILSYHGGLRTAEDQLQLDEFTNPEFNTQSFVVYPQGINVRM